MPCSLFILSSSVHSPHFHVLPDSLLYVNDIQYRLWQNSFWNTTVYNFFHNKRQAQLISTLWQISTWLNCAMVSLTGAQLQALCMSLPPQRWWMEITALAALWGTFAWIWPLRKLEKRTLLVFAQKVNYHCYFYFFKYRELYIVADCSSFDSVAYLMPFPPLVKDKYGFLSSIFPSQFLVMRTHVLYLLHTKVDFYWPCPSLHNLPSSFPLLLLHCYSQHCWRYFISSTDLVAVSFST